MATPKRSPLSINSTPTLQDVHTIISNLSKPVINVTPVNRMAETRPMPGRQLVGGPKFDPAPVIPEKPFVPKMIPHMPGSTKAMTQTSPTSFQMYDMPIPLQTEYMGQKVGAPQAPEQQAPVIPTKKPQEWYVAMDRRNELVGKLRAENPEKKALQDDELVNKYLEVNPQFTEYFKIPEPEQQVSDTMQQDEIVLGIRRDFGEEANKYTDAQLLEMRKQHEQSMQGDVQGPNTALKGMPGAMDDTAMFGLPKFGRFEPLVKRDKQKDAGAPNVGKMYANIPGSTANVVSDVANMGIDFPDVIKGLVKISRGTVANAVKNTVGLFVDDNEEKYAVALDRTKRKGGILRKVAEILETDEAMADQVRGSLGERYGSFDKIAQTMTEDPIGMVADIASIIEGGGTLLKRGGKASGATRLAQIGDEMASIGNASDPYALAIQGAGKTTSKVVEKVTTPSEPGAVSFTDRLVSAYNGLDARTVRAMKDNADLIKQMDEGTITRESLQDNTVKIVEDIIDEKGEIGKLYQEAYQSPITFDAMEVINDILSTLKEQGVKFSDDGTKITGFDITNNALANLTTEAKTALKSRFDDVMDTLQSKDSLTVEELHNIRKSLNKTTYQDGFITKKAPGVTKVVEGINKKLKKIPGFTTADDNFSKIATEASQIKKILTTTDAEGNLQARGSTKSLLSESGRKRLEVIERYAPGFRKQLEAMTAYDDYLTTREKKKVGLYNKPVSGGAGGAVGFGIAGPVGAIIGAVAGTMLHSFVTDPKRFKNRVVKRLGNKVAQKVARGEALTRAERAKMDFEAERLLARPQLALEYKPDLKTEKTQVIDAQGVVKGQPGAQTLEKQAIVDGKIVQEKTINASPIKIPGKNYKDFQRKVIETGQENVEQPKNPIKEEAKMKREKMQERYKNKRAKNEKIVLASMKKKLDSIESGKKQEKAKKEDFEAKKTAIQQAKIEKLTKYQEAKGETIKDVSKFKKGMITPEGKITNTGYNRTRAYYQVEGDGNFTYRYEGEAKAVNQVVVPEVEVKDPRDEKQTVEKVTDTENMEELEAQKWMESQIKKEMGDEYNQTKELVKEIMKIERHEQNLGKVGRNKVKDKNYKVMKEQEFTSKKERLIEKIAEKNNLTLPEAKDWYDRELDRARDIGERYQMRQEYKQEPKEVQKTMLSPKEAEARIRKYFNEDEVPVVFEDTITTPRGQEAYGKYHDGAITLVKNPKLDTPDHEALHAYFDMFTTKNRQAKVLAEVKQKQGINNNIDAEERLADGFSDYIAKKETFTGAVKEFFKDVRNDMKKIFGKEDAVRSLYGDIIKKKRPDDGKTIRSNTTKNQTTGAPYLTTKPLQDIAREVQGDTVKVNQLKNMLGRQYKKQELNQIMEVIRIAEEKGVDKLSKAEVQEIMRKEILPLEIEETKRYADYNRLYRNEYLNAVDQHMTYGMTHIYTAPIQTAINNHFAHPNYFGHVRVEDLSKRTGFNENKGNIARVIEVQSDMYQKGEETIPRGRIRQMSGLGKDAELKILDLQRQILIFDSSLVEFEAIDKFYKYLSETMDQGKKITIPEEIKAIFAKKNPRTDRVLDIEGPINEYNKLAEEVTKTLLPKEVAQLEAYANKGAYRKRMVGQEMIYQFTKGKEKIQFPDGVTIAKIEGHSIDILTVQNTYDVGEGFFIQKEYFNNVLNRILAEESIKEKIRENFVDKEELVELSNGRREDLNETVAYKSNWMNEAMQSYMDIYGLEHQGGLNFDMIDPAMFQEFLKHHGGYEILKEVRENYPQRFGDPEIIKQAGAGERTPEQAKKAIEGMRSETKTIANFYEKELIPYLEKQFGGKFLFDDGGRRLEIDMKKIFGNKEKQGIPAFQTKEGGKYSSKTLKRIMDEVGEEAVYNFRKHGLTEAEANAIADYADFEYEKMNRDMRAGTEGSQTLTSAIKKLPQIEKTVHRGMSFADMEMYNEFKESIKNGKMTDKSYMSSTTSQETQREFATRNFMPGGDNIGVYITILPSKNSKGRMIAGSYQDEVLFEPNSQFKIKKIFEKALPTPRADGTKTIVGITLQEIEAKQGVPKFQTKKYYHGTTKENYESIMKYGFDTSKNTKGFAEEPNAIFVAKDKGNNSDHSAGTYGDHFVEINISPEAKILDFNTQEGYNLQGRLSNKVMKDEGMKTRYDYTRKAGYDVIDYGNGELAIINPNVIIINKKTGIPAFQTKDTSSKSKVQSYFQEKQKQGLTEAKRDEDIDSIKEDRPSKIDGDKGYRIPGGGEQGETLTSAPMGDGMYIGFDKKSVASFYGDYEIPMEKNLERVKEYDTSNIKRGTEQDLPKELQKVKDYRRLPRKKQEKIAQARKEYMLSNGFDGMLYYDPYTANLVEGVVYKKVPETGVPKLSSSKK